MNDDVVFVVDDDKSVRRNLSRLIRSAGMEVATFSSGQSLLARDPPDRPACLILDLHMPELTGLDIQRELNQRGSCLSVLFISRHGDVLSAVQAMKQGAIDVIQKPFNAHEIINVIRHALDHNRQKRSWLAQQNIVRNHANLLTPREQEVFALVVQGRSNKSIATALGISEKTVKVHRGRVMMKMEAKSLPDLVRMAEIIDLPIPA